MLPRCLRWMPCVLAVLVAGCLHPVREQTDQAICAIAAKPLDLTPPHELAAPTPSADAPVKPVVFQASDDLPRPRFARERLEVPSELFGRDVTDLTLPPPDKEHRAERDQAIARFFPQLPTLPPECPLLPGPDGRPLSLPALQKLAMSNSPLVRQAAADVEAARGTALQVGLYPNPKVGYEADTAATAGGAGYQGGYVEQTVKTAGKLKLAQAAALMDVANAELNLKKVQNDVAAQVRSGYFAVLIARKNLDVTRAVARFTDEIYHVQIEFLRSAQSAPYEVAQFRALALQARTTVVQAHNRAIAAWKQLAATLGLPAMCPTQLEGQYDAPVPCFEYGAALTTVLQQHTDVLTAHNSIKKARYNLRLAQVTPLSDVELRAMVQKDYTSSTFLLAHSVMVSVQLPVWDQNQGNIKQSQGELLHATEQEHRVRTELTSKLAEAFERYENGRQLVDYYRRLIIPDLVRVYRGVYERYQREAGTINFVDVSTAQQALVTAITNYLTALGSLWAAVSDVAGVLQTDDLFHGIEAHDLAPLPDLDQMLALPCSHVCSPLQDPSLKGADGHWAPQPPVPTPDGTPPRRESR